MTIFISANISALHLTRPTFKLEGGDELGIQEYLLLVFSNCYVSLRATLSISTDWLTFSPDSSQTFSQDCLATSLQTRPCSR